MIITADYLQKIMACNHAINFFKRNFPNGLDLNKYEIYGEYNAWSRWLNNKLELTMEFDQYGNIVKETGGFGPSEYLSTYEYNYDQNGNILEIIKRSDNVIFKYDKYRNVVKRKCLVSGKIHEWEYTYDKSGIMLTKTSCRTEYTQMFDEYGNVIGELYPRLRGPSYNVEYEYDDRGNITKLITISNNTGNKDIVKYRYEFNKEHLMKLYREDYLICWLEKI